MAPLKFEEKMKERLEQRAIKPSENTWEKLEAELDHRDTRKKGNKILWYSIAAIFVGILVLTSVLKNNNLSPEETNPKFVDNTEKIIIEDHEDVVENREEKLELVNEKEKIVNETADEYTHKNTIQHKENNVVVQHSGSTSQEINVQDEIIEIEDNKVVSVEDDGENISNELKQQDILPINAEVINEKVTDIVAQVEELQKHKTEVTEEEINALLLNAQREITTQNILKSNTVSASALLQDVENEIDETFKQRVFEALKAGFQKVKTAVAEREN